MRNPYSFLDFLQQVKDLDYMEIIQHAEREVARVESLSYGRPGAVKAREMGSTKYAHEIKEFLFWMRYGTRPASASENNFQLYRIVANELVKKKQFKPSVMDVFDSQ